ncbi:ABC transporter permease [Aeromicrobium phragmitis]|uniref:ABC transporter permease n=1 Tax=Aeromicrobium phragmitis TaxID=2478914 RepID=A0A3L8PPW4_9ACTN|nr:ABC transporter permease [Aeromicrobium phragmitis]RLV57370.1 ABC transporter permease [Aeromicrobium phragmitis]
MTAGLSLSPFDAAWLGSVLVLMTPLLIAGAGELISERAGVLNVGLEGMMLSGAFFAFYVAYLTGSPAVALVGGVAGGLVFGLVMGALVILAGADQIVAGVGINLAAIGLTSFLFDQIFGGQDQVIVATLGEAPIPVLSSIPYVGSALFGQDLLVYGAIALIVATWFVLFKSSWGLMIRSVGEMPQASRTAGISVAGVQWAGVLIAAGLGGLAGAYLSVVDVGIFKEQMTDGRGFLVLVAVIFGRWRPWGLVCACLILAAADGLQLRLANVTSVPRSVWVGLLVAALLVAGVRWWRRRVGATGRGALAVTAASILVPGGLLIFNPDVHLPDQLWRSLPYLLALSVLAAGVSRSRMPSRLGLQPLRHEG